MYEYHAEILRVVDGDTVHARLDLGIDVRIDLVLRLDGINAPELPSIEGLAAKAWLIARLAGASNVVTVKTVKVHPRAASGQLDPSRSESSTAHGDAGSGTPPSRSSSGTSQVGSASGGPVARTAYTEPTAPSASSTGSSSTSSSGAEAETSPHTLGTGVPGPRGADRRAAGSSLLPDSQDGCPSGHGSDGEPVHGAQAPGLGPAPSPSGAAQPSASEPGRTPSRIRSSSIPPAQDTEKQEKYGRYLAVLFDAAGININQEMVDAGQAVPYDGHGPR